MNLLQRLRYTADFFRTGFDNSRNQLLNQTPRNTKKTPLRFSNRSSDQPMWSMVDYETFSREGFEGNSVIYAAIMTKVRAVSQVDLKAASGDVKSPTDIEPNNTRRDFELDAKTENTEGQALANLLNRPNKYMSGSEFQQLQTTLLNITGNAFTLIERARGSYIPKALWPLNAMNVQIVPSADGELKGYLYSPKGSFEGDDRLPILASDMMHVKLPNPNDPLQGLGFGLSPILPLAKSADVDNQITTFLKVFFEHGAMPSGALKLKDMMLDEDSIEEIKERFMATYGNYENWADVAVLDMTMEYERIGLTFNEMDFTNLDERNESRILLPFGVPAELLPIRLGLQGSTFANKEEARKWFWQDTMMFELNLFLDEYKSYLTTESGIFPRWDISKVDALKDNVTEQITGAVQLIQNGVPPKIAFETVGLEIEQYEGFEKPRETSSPFGNFGSEPVDDEIPEVPDDETEDEPAEDEKSLKINDDKQELWSKFDNLAQKHEPNFADAADAALEEERSQILAIVSRAKKKSLEQKASLNNVELQSDITDYLFSDGKDNWREKFFPVVVTEVEDLGSTWLDQFGTTFSLRNIEGEAWFEDYMLQFANPITQTSNDTIHGVIGLAMEEGWSNDQLANRLGDVYDTWLTGVQDPVDFAWWHSPAANPHLGNRTLQWRRELIARTETTRAANAGANSLFGNWGVTQKEWLATSDSRTRPHHRFMSGDRVPLNGKFMSGLGNHLRYPGDPNAPLADTAQCRCTILPYGDVIDENTVDEAINSNPEDAIHYRDYRENIRTDDFKRFDDDWRRKIDTNLTDDEKEELKKYTGGYYKGYNRWLRGADEAEFGQRTLVDYKRTKAAMDSTNKKVGLTENTVLYRNVDFDALPHWGLKQDLSDIDNLVGMTLTDKAAMSASMDGHTFSSSPLQFEISAPKGTPGAYINSISTHGDRGGAYYNGELEYLLPRDTRIEVTRIEKVLGFGDKIRKIKIWATLLP